MGTFWNTYAFYVLYADIDGFDPTAHALRRENLSPMDKWILSRLNSLVKAVDAYLGDIRITEPAGSSSGLSTTCPTGMSAAAATATGARI